MILQIGPGWSPFIWLRVPKTSDPEATTATSMSFCVLDHEPHWQLSQSMASKRMIFQMMVVSNICYLYAETLGKRIWLVVSNIWYFHLYLGKWSNLTSIFFRWVGSTTNSFSGGPKKLRWRDFRTKVYQLFSLKAMVVGRRGSTIRTLLHGKIGPLKIDR